MSSVCFYGLIFCGARLKIGHKPKNLSLILFLSSLRWSARGAIQTVHLVTRSQKTPISERFHKACFEARNCDLVVRRKARHKLFRNWLEGSDAERSSALILGFRDRRNVGTLVPPVRLWDVPPPSSAGLATAAL